MIVPLTLLFIAGEVPFFPGRIDVTSTTNGGWHSDLEYGEIFERLNVATGTAGFQLAVRLDTATFISSPTPEIDDRYTLEKVTLGWASRALEVSLGDAYVSFGRGLVLSLRKVDELGIDTTLRGAKALFHGENWSGTIAAGTPNINNVDEASGKSVDDPFDLAAGAQVQARIFELATVGVLGSVVAFHDPLGLIPSDRWEEQFFQFGPMIDIPRLGEFLSLYLEGVGQLREGGSREGGEEVGVGAYGSATAFFGPATLLFEGKVYGDLRPLRPNLERAEFAGVSYHSPPTLERVKQLLEHPQRDVAGGHLRFDWTFSAEAQAFLNYGLFRDTLGYDDPATSGTVRPGTIHDAHAGAEARWDAGRSYAIITGGYRSVLLDESQELVRGDGFLEVDLAQSLGGSLTLAFQAIHDERKKFESRILDSSHREGTVLVGLRLADLGSVSAGYDYTTDPTSDEDHFISGTAQWDLTSSSSVRLFVGSTRGGLRCVSGVCRVFPPFEGAKLSATLRF